MGMTVKELILEKEIKLAKERLAGLKKMDAPMVMIDSLTKQIKEMKAGEIKIGGNQELLDYEFTEYRVQLGRGGKYYISFDGIINYFPTARYGRYISKNTAKEGSPRGGRD